MTLVLYALLSTALWYLGSRAVITRALWSRYPRGVAGFMDCPACTGFWHGIALSLTLGRHEDLSVFGIAADMRATPIVVGLSMIVLVPILAGVMQWGLDHAGNAIISDDEA